MNLDYELKFGKNIKVLREHQGLTQEQVSAKLQLMGCDITRSAVAKMEVGQRHIYPDEILALKTILNTSFDKMFYGKEYDK